MLGGTFRKPPCRLRAVEVGKLNRMFQPEVLAATKSEEVT